MHNYLISWGLKPLISRFPPLFLTTFLEACHDFTPRSNIFWVRFGHEIVYFHFKRQLQRIWWRWTRFLAPLLQFDKVELRLNSKQCDVKEFVSTSWRQCAICGAKAWCMINLIAEATIHQDQPWTNPNHIESLDDSRFVIRDSRFIQWTFVMV